MSGSEKKDIKGGQLNMAMCFWYLVKTDLSNVHVYTVIAYS